MASETNYSFNNIATLQLNTFPNRPTIVFLHDSWGCIDLWRDFPEKLGELTRCNILIYDRIGYGKSCPFTEKKRTNSYLENEADFLIELLDHLKISNPILFGHSDGGSIALIAGGKHPKRIRGIITEGAHIYVEDETITGIKKAVELYHTADLKKKLERYHGDKTEALFWAWASTWTSDEFKSWNIEEFLTKIQCSCLVIQGENDEYATQHQVERAVDKINAQATKLIVKNTKHTPHKENPEQVLSKSAEFINQL